MQGIGHCVLQFPSGMSGKVVCLVASSTKSLNATIRTAVFSKYYLPMFIHVASIFRICELKTLIDKLKRDLTCKLGGMQKATNKDAVVNFILPPL